MAQIRCGKIGSIITGALLLGSVGAVAGGCPLGGCPLKKATSQFRCFDAFAGFGVKKNLAIVTFAGMFARMIYKSEQESSQTIRRDARWLMKNANRAFTTGYLKRAWNFIKKLVDDGIIGSPGRKRGLRVYGSKIGMEGEMDLTGTQTNSAGEKLELYRCNDMPAYGIMGTIWAYFVPIKDGFKHLKEAGDLVEYGGKQLIPAP